jgi:hypothetical protein
LCANGATCVDHIQSYTCNCVPGFNGQRCEHPVNMQPNTTSNTNSTDNIVDQTEESSWLASDTAMVATVGSMMVVSAFVGGAFLFYRKYFKPKTSTDPTPSNKLSIV